MQRQVDVPHDRPALDGVRERRIEDSRCRCRRRCGSSANVLPLDDASRSCGRLAVCVPLELLLLPPQPAATIASTAAKAAAVDQPLPRPTVQVGTSRSVFHVARRRSSRASSARAILPDCDTATPVRTVMQVQSRNSARLRARSSSGSGSSTTPSTPSRRVEWRIRPSPSQNATWSADFRVAVGDEIAGRGSSTGVPAVLLLVGVARHEPAGRAEAHVDEAGAVDACRRHPAPLYGVFRGGRAPPRADRWRALQPRRRRAPPSASARIQPG